MFRSWISYPRTLIWTSLPVQKPSAAPHSLQEQGAPCSHFLPFLCLRVGVPAHWSAWSLNMSLVWVISALARALCSLVNQTPFPLESLFQVLPLGVLRLFRLPGSPFPSSPALKCFPAQSGLSPASSWSSWQRPSPHASPSSLNPTVFLLCVILGCASLDNPVEVKSCGPTQASVSS